MSLLGIDVGTTGCKAVVYGVDGRRLSDGHFTYSIDRREGKAEFHVSMVEAAVASAVKTAVSGAINDPVTALCVTSMGEAFVLIDETGPVCDVSIAGHDPRGKDEFAPVADRIGAQAFHAISGNTPSVNHSLPKLLWLAGHEPEMFTRAKKFLCWSDYISFRLGAVPATGYSQANRTLLFDLHKGQWSETIIAAAGLDASLFPMVLPEGSVVGTVSPEGSVRFGVPAGAVIILGGHDQIFNALGAGCIGSNSAVDGMGTFECITPIYSAPPPSAELFRMGLNLEHHCISGLFVSFVYNQSGSVADWFVRNFVRETASHQEAFARIESEMPRDVARPLFLPLLENSGSPYFITEASGVYEGIKFDTDRGEIFKATLEGITFYYLESLKRLGDFGIELEELAVTGGASASDAWLALKSDIFGIPVVRLAVKDAGAMGAAMLAGIKTGVYRDAAEAAALYVHRTDVFEPDPSRHRLYLERFDLYRTMYSERSERLLRLSRLSGY